MTICAYTLHQTTIVSNQTSHSPATRVDKCAEVLDGKVPGGNLEASPDTMRCGLISANTSSKWMKAVQLSKESYHQIGHSHRESPTHPLSERIIAPTPTTEPPTGSQALTTPVKVLYSRKRAHKLDENEDFLNKVRKYNSRPEHWSLYMWTALVGWHQNPMSVPNALREDNNGYFLEQDVDIAAWLTKVIGELPRQAIMLRMKGIFGSCTNFETACYGFDLNLFCAEMHRS
ncbi:hypothetical protein M422DRAFT_255455 [Sphaerobolus stellatus SS14]|uniref:Uncharacterized protein n=1 Tax=Sphaerobolus stellatus (strain SS14) TaxID=990650 RepID=A0A0C9VSU7_SPHS4|nr:hypothetical protein M422DRAFT_255455 [Sphaerobolus stellatus SS14]